MKTITFGYNILYVSSTSIFILFFTMLLARIAFLLDTPIQWFIFIPVTVVILAMERFFLLNFLVPWIKNKPALLLDDEKLIYFISDEIILWKNVVKISQQGKMGIGYRYLVFEMSNGDRIEIGTKWIDGSENFMFATIQEFYNKAVKEG